MTVQKISDQLVMNALPGTMRQVAHLTGLHVETVSAVLKRLNVRGRREVCIYDYLPPKVPGQHWTPLWKVGSGANYRLPASRKAAHTKAVKDRTRPENRAKVCANGASWLDVLPIAA